LNILLLSQVVPYPPDAGPKVKTYHVLRYLAAAGHRVTLVSFVRAQNGRSASKCARSARFCTRCRRSIACWARA